jgi:hypothetical protein
MSHRGAVLTLYGCALTLAASALVLVVTNSLVVAIVLAVSLIVLTIAFFAFVILRARLARRRLDAAEAASPPSPRPVAPGGVLGRQ